MEKVIKLKVYLYLLFLTALVIVGIMLYKKQKNVLLLIFPIGVSIDLAGQISIVSSTLLYPPTYDKNAGIQYDSIIYTLIELGHWLSVIGLIVGVVGVFYVGRYIKNNFT